MTYENFFEIRAFPGGKDQYKHFLENNIVAIGWGNTNDISKMNLSEIEGQLKSQYPDGNAMRMSQVKNMLFRFKSFKINDILLIPYKKEKKITIAKVVKEYRYEKADLEKHMAHKVGIEEIKTVSEDDLSESLNNTLKARLTLTRISEDKYTEILSLISSGKYSKESLAYQENIKRIEKVFNESEEYLVKNALLLSAFSLCESYLIKDIKDKINTIDTSFMKSLQIYIHEKGKKAFEKDLERFHTRKKVFKCLYGYDLQFPTKTQNEIRNFLAHDITTPNIEGDLIYIPTIDTSEQQSKEKDDRESTSIKQLFKSFKNFPSMIIYTEKENV